MQQYLDDGGIEAIIKPLMQRLLNKKPHEPVAFIIKDLCSHYPNEAGKTVAALNKVSEYFYYYTFEYFKQDDLLNSTDTFSRKVSRACCFHHQRSLQSISQ